MAASLGLAVLASVAFTFAITLDAGAQSGGYSGRTADEMKCQSGVGKALGKFAGAKTKCVQKCIATQRKALTPAYAGCFGPGFFDPATSSCVTDSLKGAETRARGSIGKACSKDCPDDCYAPGECSTGTGFVIRAEQRLDFLDDLIWCIEGAGATPTKAEQKCEDMVAKTTAKLAGAITKCYDACVVKEFKGTIPFGSCLAPTPFDPATAACLTKAVTKGAAKIDGKCAIPGANPACYVPDRDTGAEWTDPNKAFLDAEMPLIFCGSPSGAFLD
jgi:hypothetical protein